MEKLIEELDQPDGEIRAQVRDQLVQIGADAVESLIAAMQNPNLRISWQAAVVLEQIPDPRWIQPMVEALSSTNILLGQAATSALESALHQGAVDYFLQALPQCRLVVQIAMVNALERIRDVHCVEALSNYLEATPSPELRYNIIQALGVIGDTRVIPLIRNYLDDPDRHVQERVRIALARLSNNSIQE